MANQKVRTIGSNFTTFRYAGKSIAYLEMVADSGQTLVSGDSGAYEFIHPLGYTHPTEIVASRVINGGILTLSIKEIWHEEIWEQMAGLAGTTDIAQVLERLARQQNYVTCTKIITPPDGRRYGKTYHRCMILNVPDGETISLGALSATKSLTVGYTHTTPL